MKWDYGGAHERHDMNGIIELPNNSLVQVFDWTTGPLPDFMRQADTVFVDPPWNAGNVRTFYTKADLASGRVDFRHFLGLLWERILEISPQYLFLEMGKEHLGEILVEAKRRWKYVTFYNSTYYHKKQNICYVIHATNDYANRRYKCLEGMDEQRIIEWICRHHSYQCIGDICMGQGLVGWNAYLAGKRFVGTELNRKRLAVLVECVRNHYRENGLQ